MQAGTKAVGHPVDVATGTVYFTRKDIEIPGKIMLVWERRYSTSLLTSPPTPLGCGWATPYFAALKKVDQAYHFLTPEGSIEVFADPDRIIDRGMIVRNFGTFQELVKQGDDYVITRWNPESADIQRYVFTRAVTGDAWPLTRIENATGQALEMVRDRGGLLTAVRQRLEKRALVLDYTPQGLIKSVSFLRGNQSLPLTRYEYGDGNRLVAITDALGAQERYEYTAENRVTREVARDGAVFFFQYDENGRCVKTAGLDRYDEKTIRYFEGINWTEVKDSLGNKSRYQWLPTGQVVLEINPLGGKKGTAYDEYGRIVEKTNAIGGSQTYVYDERGDRTKITDPLGQEWKLTFNDAHLPLTQTTPDSRTFSRTYDAAGRLKIAEDPTGGRWLFTHDADGNLVEVNANGAVQRWVFSSNGRLREGVDAEGFVTQFELDEFGRVTERKDPSGGVTRYRYDLMGTLREVTRPDNTTIRYQHDAAKNLTQLTDRNGQTTRYRYGTCRRLLEIIDATGGSTKLQWGSEPHHLLAVVNANQDRYSFGYDTAGRLVQETDFAGNVIKFEYDDAGNRIGMTNGLGEHITYELDELGRTIGILLPDGTKATYAYDVTCNVIVAANSDFTIRYKRDALGRILEEDQGGHLLHYSYTRGGKVAQVRSDLPLTIDYAYDRRNLLSQLSVDHRHTFAFVRDARGCETRRELPGTVVLEQEVDPLGRLLAQRVFRGQVGPQSRAPFSGTPLIQRAYTWDAARVTGIEDRQWGSLRFIYDAVEQLTEAVEGTGHREAFNYDATGNLKRMECGALAQDLECGVGNQLLRKGNIKYTYDGIGRLAIKADYSQLDPEGKPKEWYYQWDALDQLRSVTTPEGELWKYAYDPFGRRMLKRGPSGDTRYVWNRDVILHELTSPVEPATWILALNTHKPLALLQEGRIYAAITDHLGTPRELVDRDGRLAWSARFSSWGRVRDLGDNRVKCPIRFRGQWFDEETGLHYNRFRYYDPDTGRFVSPDPIGLRGGLNLYRYVPNPINWIDPFGLDWNYVLVDADGNTYYTGQANDSASQAAVERRHGNNIGQDGNARLDPARGDRLVPVATDLDHETSRGLEQRLAEDLTRPDGTPGLVIGRQGSATNPDGSTRGNLQDPVNQNDSNADARDRRAAAAQQFLDDNETTSEQLVRDAINRANEEEEEEGCA